MLKQGKLLLAELYDDHKAPYTNVKAVYEANKDRYPGAQLMVCNAHWYGSGPKAVGNYKVDGNVLSQESEFWTGFGWKAGRMPEVADTMTAYENFLSTIPAIINGKTGDMSASNWGAGVARKCNRTWWGFKADGTCLAEVSTVGYTLQAIADRMESLGIVNGLILDGSGSSQAYDGNEWLKGDGRTVYSFLLLWFEGEEKNKEEGEDNMKIYLSPSAQPANAYATGGTTEQVQCNRIAEAAKKALERCGFTVKKAPEGQSYQKNVEESNAWGADLHVPIHTNAGGGYGPVVFVYSKTAARTKYAQPVYDELCKIVPKANSYGVRANAGLYEVAKTTAPCVYIECEFHDNAALARWIIDHVESIGEAICKGICQGAGVSYVAAEAKELSLEERVAALETWARANGMKE